VSHWHYLPFLLAWALPICAIQWLLGGRYLWRERRRWLPMVLALGTYLSMADVVPIRAGIWRFDATSLLGVYLGPVPVEELLFYVLTTAMVIQGFVIAWAGWQDRPALVARWRAKLALLRRYVR
jgi:lycopene cyclase domain-containing protein